MTRKHYTNWSRIPCKLETVIDACNHYSLEKINLSDYILCCLCLTQYENSTMKSFVGKLNVSTLGAHSFWKTWGNLLNALIRYGYYEIQKEVYFLFATTSLVLTLKLWKGGTAPKTNFMTVWAFFSKIATHWWQVRYVSCR